ncbi:MAG TPA: SRPBCC domain-containing protein [Solirubrobacterales bacterium]|nr:SRPBCC domain-containing protein [Solirubrobacterales bacterium]
MNAGMTLRIERIFAAPAERVFEAWTSEEVLRRWFHAKGHWETSEAEVDLRLGGAVRVVMRDTDEGRDIGGGGTYTEIDPPTRLAFTWTWDDDSARETLIELDFLEAEGRTTVLLTHSALADEQAVRNHEEGWSQCLENLGRAIERG